MFLFIMRDGLDKKFENRVSSTSIARSYKDFKETLDIRRPLRGIQIKDDTYATLSIWTAGGDPIRVTSGSARFHEGDIGDTIYYADFILQRVEEQRSEKIQIMETFGSPFIYLYGEKPRFVSFSGLLMNTEDFNWRSTFWHNYENFLRGTKLAERGARAFFSYDTRVVEGYPITASASDSSDTPYSVPFTMSMIVTNFYDYSDIGSVKFPQNEADINETVNAELSAIDARRKEFVSTGAEVRLLNLTASGGGLGAALRSGLRSINEVKSTVGGFTDTLNDIVGGRSIRMPIGVAGFLHATGAAQVAAGSLRPEGFSEDSGIKMYDAATGTYKSVMGSLKLRMPSTGQFTATGPENRGFKSDNIDEYPLAQQPLTLGEVLRTRKQFEAITQKKIRDAARQQSQKLLNEQYAIWNGMAEAGKELDDIATVVNAIKSGIGLAMSVQAFIRDPLGSLKASLGITGIPNFNFNPFGSFFGSASPERTALPLTGVGDSEWTKVEKDTVVPDFAKVKNSEWSRSPTLLKQKLDELGIEQATPEQIVKLEESLGKNSTKVRQAEFIRNALSKAGLVELQTISTTAATDTSTAGQRYLGSNAVSENTTFKSKFQAARELLSQNANPDEEINVGFVYESGAYISDKSDVPLERYLVATRRTGLVGSAEYEEAYNKKDYSTLAERSTGSAEAITTVEDAYAAAYQEADVGPHPWENVYAGTDYTSLAYKSSGSTEKIEAVRKAYADAYSDQELDFSEQEIGVVYEGKFVSEKRRTARDLLETIRISQREASYPVEELKRIRGVANKDIDIDPVR